MRYPIMTIHEEEDIVVTATVEKDSEEFLSHRKVTGIVLYVEQYRKEVDGLATMSILISDSGTVTLLRNRHFPEDFVRKFLEKIFSMSDKIREYVKAQEKQI